MKDVKISVKFHDTNELSEIHKWLNAKDWRHIVDWRWFAPAKGKDTPKFYIFQFENDQHAVEFALRWL